VSWLFIFKGFYLGEGSMFNASRSRFKRPGTELVEEQCFAFKVQGSMLRVQGSKGRALSLSKCNASRSYFDRLSNHAARSRVQSSEDILCL